MAATDVDGVDMKADSASVVILVQRVNHPFPEHLRKRFGEAT